MPIPSTISQAKTSNAIWILSLLIVGCGHDPSLEMDVPVAESSDSITDALATVSGNSNTNDDLSARLTKLEDAQRSLSINLLRVNEQLRQMTNALEAISGEEVVRQSSQTSSGVDTLLTPTVTTLNEMRDLLATAFTSRDPELLYALYPKRSQYDFILGTRKQLVSDRLAQIELERAYSDFFDDHAKVEINAIDEMIEILLQIDQRLLPWLRNAEKVDLFVYRYTGDISMTGLQDKGRRLLSRKARSFEDSTDLGMFIGISSPSDVILKNYGGGSLTFEVQNEAIFSISVGIVRLDGQWFVWGADTKIGDIWTSRFQAKVNDGDYELISDNSSRFDAIYNASEDGKVSIVSVRPPVETNSTLDSTNTTGSVDDVADPSEEPAEDGFTNSTN